MARGLVYEIYSCTSWLYYPFTGGEMTDVHGSVISSTCTTCSKGIDYMIDLLSTKSDLILYTLLSTCILIVVNIAAMVTMPCSPWERRRHFSRDLRSQRDRRAAAGSHTVIGRTDIRPACLQKVIRFPTRKLKGELKIGNATVVST